MGRQWDNENTGSTPWMPARYRGIKNTVTLGLRQYTPNIKLFRQNKQVDHVLIRTSAKQCPDVTYASLPRNIKISNDINKTLLTGSDHYPLKFQVTHVSRRCFDATNLH